MFRSRACNARIYAGSNFVAFWIPEICTRDHTAYFVLTLLPCNVLAEYPYPKRDNSLPYRDRECGTTYNYLISKEGMMSVFALHNEANPVKLLWKAALSCLPCSIHSLAIPRKYVIFIRNVRYLPPIPFHAKLSKTETARTPPSH